MPRTSELQAAMTAHADGSMDAATHEEIVDAAVAGTIARFEATGAPS